MGDCASQPEETIIGIYRLTRFLSRLALISVLIAVAIAYYEILPIGYEGVVFVSSVAVVLAILAGGLSLLLAAYLAVRGFSPKPVNPALISTLAIGMALIYVWAM